MRPRDENKLEMLRKTALQMIVKDGLDGLSIQKLAKAAGCSPATIYIYHKDKEDFIVQLCLHEFNAMADATLKNFDPEMPFAEGLKVQWINRAEYYIKHPLNHEFWDQMRHSRYQEIVFSKQDNRFMEVMRTFVHSSIKRKELVSLPVEVYWSIAFGPLYQLLKFHIQGKSFRNRNEKFELTEKLMLQALEIVIKALTP
jgi:TetR/AcrR family transcriptional regulator, multidrug resistance operon repressor